MKSPINRFNPINHPMPFRPSDGRVFNYGSDNLKPGYRFGSAPGSADMVRRPDGSVGPSIPSYGYITDSMGKVVAKQGDANWNDFYNPVVEPNPIVEQAPPVAPASPVAPVALTGSNIGGRMPAPRFGGIRRVLGRGR